MKPQEYMESSLRTVPETMQFWNPNPALYRGPQRARLQLLNNCALGLAGEAAEIAQAIALGDVDLSDEIGDGYWYAYVMHRVLDMEVTIPRPVPGDAWLPSLHDAAGMICELTKKILFHGRDIDDEKTLADLRENLKWYTNALDALDPQEQHETLAQNYKKLEARYPDGFFQRG